MLTNSSNFSKHLVILAKSSGLTLKEETVELFHILRGEDFTINFLTSAIADAKRLAILWELNLEPALSGGVQSLCFKGYTQNGLSIVLKIPSVQEEGLLEVQALKIWGEHSEVKVLAEDPEGKGFLMTYIENKPASQKLEAVSTMVTKLHKTEQLNSFKNIFPQVNKTMEAKILSVQKRFIDSPDQFNHDKNLNLAKHICDLLLTYQQFKKIQTLLHGDMKNHNILSTSQGLVAIDPQPCLGDELYDIATWIAGSVHDKPIEEILLEFLVFGYPDFNRLFLWTWVLAVTENRPNHKPYAIERQTFINEFYFQALETSENFKALILAEY